MSDLREAFRHAADCPAPELLIEAMEHGGANRDTIAPHVEKCPACQTELAMFRGFEAGAVQPDEREAVDFIVRRLRGEHEAEAKLPIWKGVLAWLTPVRMGGFALAAAAVLLTVGLSTQWQTRRGISGPLPESAVTRSAVIKNVSPAGELPAFPDQISWEQVPGAVAYDVTVSEVDRTVIFHNTFTTPVLAVPPDIRRMIVPGKTVLVSVRAKDTSGIEIAQSGQIKIVVRPAGQ